VEVPIDGSYADGNLITAPAWPAHPSWLKKVLKAVGADTHPTTKIEYVSEEE
jgi:protease I